MNTTKCSRLGHEPRRGCEITADVVKGTDFSFRIDSGDFYLLVASFKRNIQILKCLSDSNVVTSTEP